MTHTPREWRVEPCSNGGLIVVRGEHRTQIVPEADARLIAAAPNLLEETAKAKTTFFYIRNLAHEAWRDPENLLAICKRIENYAQMHYDLLEAAISKARGE